MKPLPPELIAAYPRSPNSTRLPDRPWWQYVDTGFGCASYVRLGDRSDPFLWRADNADHAARIDAEHPLPFPGVRVGQTWAHPASPSWPSVFTITEQRGPNWYAGGAWFSGAEISALCATGFLLADTACPHLAPWAPALDQP